MRPILRTMSLCAGLMWGAGTLSAQTSVCQTDGPDLNTTWQYINNAMISAGAPDQFNLRTYTDTAVIAIFTGTQSYRRDGSLLGVWEDELDETAPINGLNCASYGANGRADGFLVYVACTNGRSCSHYSGNGEAPNAFGLIYKGDQEHAKRLAAALSRYVYLVQQDWKKAHDDPNDPFSHK